MGQVVGTVEAVSTKFDKFSILVNGVWYNTKQEWAPDPQPRKGDNVSFDDGGKNYLKKLSVTGGGVSPATVGGGASRGNAMLGVELGHAANLAIQKVLSENHTSDEDFWKSFDRNTDIAYQIMKAKRSSYEQGEVKAKADMAKVEAVEKRLSGIKKPSTEDIF